MFLPGRSSQTALSGADAPTSQRGTLRWLEVGGRGTEVTGPPREEPWRVGRGVSSFQPLLPWRAQPPKGPKATATQTTDISCGAAPPTVRCQPETGHRGRARRPTPPAREREALSEARGGRPTRLPAPTCRGRSPATPEAPRGGLPGAPEPTRSGKLRRGCGRGRDAQAPRGVHEGPKVRLALWF